MEAAIKEEKKANAGQEKNGKTKMVE